MWHVDDVLKAVGGTLYRIERAAFSGVSTDSRSISEGELFIPLAGKSFDGHTFIEAAYERSHGGTICERGRESLLQAAKGTIILVDNTTKALLDLARYKRRQTRGTFIAITGSNGKTTTKEILIRIMGMAFPVHFNEKNYNNLIGVSKSILSIDGTADFYIFELGTNSRGEIRQLAEITGPDLSLITNINPSHLEGLSDVEGVLEEKLDLFYLTKRGGKVLINADDPWILPRYRDAGHVVHTFSMLGEADFQLRIDEDLGWDGYALTLALLGKVVKTRTSLLGKHNLYNILSAASLAYATGIDTVSIKEAVEEFTPYAMRFKPLKSSLGYIVVDDSYNANPSSMEWATATLSDLPCVGRRIAIIGDMRELGEKSAFYHRELGKRLNSSGIDLIVLIGEEVKETFRELEDGRAKLFGDKASLVEYVRKQLAAEDVVLVKGSRAAKMEEIVEALV